MTEIKITDSFSDLIEWAEKYVTSNDVFVDVGANEGLVSYFVNEACSPRELILIDGDPQWKDVKKLLPATYIDKIVLDEPGRKNMYFVDGLRASTSIYDRFGPNKEAVHSLEAEVTTLDEILKDVEGPIVLKIDTEVSEHLVWKGAKNILPKVRLAVVEFMPQAIAKDAGINPEDFLNEIRSAGFDICWLNGNRISNQRIMKVPFKIDLFLQRV